MHSGALEANRNVLKRCAPFCLAVAFLAAFAIAFVSCASAQTRDAAEADYNALDKPANQSTMGADLAALRRLTREAPHLLWLTSLLDPSSDIGTIASGVLRLDTLDHSASGGYYDDSCTATMLSHDIAITALHCLKSSQATIIRARLVAGYQALGAQSAIQVEDVNLGKTQMYPGIDVALIQTVAPFPDWVVPVRLRYRPPIVGETLILISYPLGQPRRLSSGNCVVQSISEVIPGEFTHTCATFSGSSGALLIGASDFAILGIHVEQLGESNIAYSLVPFFQHLAHFHLDLPGAQMVSPPAKVDRTGETISDHLLSDDFAAAVRNGKADTWLRTVPNQYYSISDLDHRLSLLNTAVALGAANVVEALLRAGIDVQNSRGKYLLLESDRSYDRFRLHDAVIINDLLNAGAPIAPFSDGVMPYCEPEARPELRRIYAQHRAPAC